MLDQWWVWIVIIFIVLFVVWAWSRFIGEETSKSKDVDNTSTVSDTSAVSDTSKNIILNTKSAKVTRTVRKTSDRKIAKFKHLTRTKSLVTTVPIVSTFSSTFSGSKHVKLSNEMIIRYNSLEQQSRTKGKGKTPSQSIGEAECLRVLEKLRRRKGRVQVRNLNVLKNRVTGRNLELDIYFENDLNLEGYKHLACEYNGRQHYELVPYFHKNGEEDLLYQQWKDAEKLDMCDNAGIYLITVPPTVPFNEIENFIIWNLPENAYKRLKSKATRQ